MAVEVTRRAALQSLATAAAGGRAGTTLTTRTDRTAASSDAAESDAAPLTVATRNLYLGADLFRLFFEREGSPAETVGELLETVDGSAVERRMDAIAAELATARPDVIGVQEAALIRTERPSDRTPGGAPDADTRRYDFLALLRDALAARGVAYDAAAVTTNTDAEFPAVVDGDRVDVRLTDRDAVLVRSETVEAEDVTTASFDAALTVEVDDGFTLTRGYAAADLRVRGRELTAASTHLEPASAGTRLAQAEELRAALSNPATATVLGDLNDGPGDGPSGDAGAYEALTTGEAFADAHAAVHADAAHPTCCFPPSLREGDPETALTGRYDVVLSRGLRPTAARRVGADPSERITVDGDSLWPSDHAGVVASFGPAPTVTPAGSEPTAEPASTADAATGTDARTPGANATGSAAPGSSTASTEPGTGTGTATPGAAVTDDPTAGAGPTPDTTTTTAPGFGGHAAVLGALAASAWLAERSRNGGE